MKRLIMCLLALSASLPVFCQMYIAEGDACFEHGDYACAVAKYKAAFESSSGKDRQIADLKRGKAENCQQWIKNANQAFTSKEYTTAKAEYQKVLESNLQDEYTAKQIEKCNNALKPLRKATTTELTDIWNNKYGTSSERRQNLVDAGIDPDDAQRRINQGEGKPVAGTNSTTVASKGVTTLTVSTQNVSFNVSGETAIIDVKTNANDFQVRYLPSWCRVNSKHLSWFSLECDANSNYQARSDWFKVVSGDKEVKINISQSGTHQSAYTTNNRTTSSIASKKTTVKHTSFSDFNSPKTNDAWGLTLGYTSYDYAEGFQLGVKFEPLFKYGFGLNTGINLEAISYKDYDGYSSDYTDVLDKYSINIPLHLEYRLNFSKSFSMFFYGGLGFNAVTNSAFDDYALPVTFEYGGGFRVSHVQLNIGKSRYIGDLEDFNNIGRYNQTYQKYAVSISYMF